MCVQVTSFETCPSCERRGRKREYGFHGCTYGEYIRCVCVCVGGWVALSSSFMYMRVCVCGCGYASVCICFHVLMCVCVCVCVCRAGRQQEKPHLVVLFHPGW